MEASPTGSGINVSEEVDRSMHPERSPAGSESYPQGRRRPRHLQSLFDRLDPRELVVVRHLSHQRSRRAVHAAAVAINRFGDGWLYPPLLIYAVAALGPRSIKLTLLAAASVALSHLVYPTVKVFLGRQRPFERDPELVSPCPPLDVFSCPSGHCMTAAAAFIPLGMADHTLGLALLVLWFLIAWARLALAHHYPSDLIVGAALGAGVSMVCCHLPFADPVLNG